MRRHILITANKYNKSRDRDLNPSIMVCSHAPSRSVISAKKNLTIIFEQQYLNLTNLYQFFLYFQKIILLEFLVDYLI